jgi:hypothetical protein
VITEPLMRLGRMVKFTLHRLAYNVRETALAYEWLHIDRRIKKPLVAGLRTGASLAARKTAEFSNER